MAAIPNINIHDVTDLKQSLQVMSGCAYAMRVADRSRFDCQAVFNSAAHRGHPRGHWR
jgi:hypothetical protein